LGANQTFFPYLFVASLDLIVFRGDGEQPKKRATTKPSSLSKAKAGTKPATRSKKTKPVAKAKEEKGKLEPSIEAPPPAEISTEQGKDALKKCLD